MSLGVRLKQARQKKNLTQEELADLVGIKQQAVQRIEAGKVKSTSYIVQLAQALDVSPQWLALGEETVAAPTPIPAPIVKDADQTFFHHAPLIDWHDIHTINQLPLRDHNGLKFPVLGRINNRCFALQVKDQSMLASTFGEPSFMKGDYLIIDSSATPQADDFVIVKLSHSTHMTFRQLIKKDETEQLQLKALNEKYADLDFDDDMQICGVVLHRYSNFDE